MSKILVTGATGELGKAVVRALLTRTEAENVIALVRTPEKADELKTLGVETREGDYDNFDSLVKAFTGIDKLYFVSGNDLEARIQQHETVVKAAKEADVKHVVYSSFARKNETDSSPIALVAKGHFVAEEALKASGLTYTILKHNLYMEVLPLFFGEQVLENGIYLPAGEGKTGFVSRLDMAETGAAVLTTEGHENKEYEITAAKAYSMQEIADLLSEISGKAVAYTSPSPEEFTETLKGFGLPEPIIGMTLGFALAIAQNDLDQTSDIVEKLSGKTTTSMKDFLKAVYA